jgi:glycosyltransferase involved in cell wall biosynthesis
MKLTIAIITRRRPESLEKCLSSIYCQSEGDFGILIVDNDMDQNAFPVFERFRKLGKIPITYVHGKNAGYSTARNFALNNCNTRFIGFVDDDCVLDEKWVSSGLSTILKFKSAYVVGCSKDIKDGKIYGQAEKYIIDNVWKSEAYDKDTLEMKAEKLDTKNLILDNELLKSLHIRFDDRFNQYGGEDADLGFQIKHKGQKGYYAKDMIVHHKEENTLKKYLYKAYCYGYNLYNLYDKWHHNNECLDWIDLKKYKFWYKPGWGYILKMEEGSFIKNIHCFLFYKAFNFFYLKGVNKNKKLSKTKVKRNTIIPHWV